MENWIIANKEWLFSGIGITALSLICVFIRWIYKGKSNDKPQMQVQNQVVNVNVGMQSKNQEQPVKNHYMNVKVNIGSD